MMGRGWGGFVGSLVKHCLAHRFEQHASVHLPQDGLTVKCDLGSKFYSFCSTQQCPAKLQSAGDTLVLQA